MFGLVVYNCGIDPCYFYDEMTIAEVQAVVDNYNLNYQNQWNQTRWLGYINCLNAGNKLKSPQELITFNWEVEADSKEVEAEDIEITKIKLLELLNSI